MIFKSIKFLSFANKFGNVGKSNFIILNMLWGQKNLLAVILNNLGADSLNLILIQII